MPSLSEFYTRTFKPAYAFPPVFFSPDSNQVAYAYSKSDGTSQTVYFINGQEMVHGTSFEFPAFGPDSKHFVVMGWNGHELQPDPQNLGEEYGTLCINLAALISGSGSTGKPRNCLPRVLLSCG